MPVHAIAKCIVTTFTVKMFSGTKITNKTNYISTIIILDRQMSRIVGQNWGAKVKCNSVSNLVDYVECISCTAKILIMPPFRSASGR